jgi:hypothetical protein
MVSRKFHLHDGKSGAALAVRITPRASKNEVTEIQNDGTVRIRLTVSAAEDVANPALITFLSELLEISPGKIDIVAGKTGKDKLVSILDMDAESVQKKILAHL